MEVKYPRLHQCTNVRIFSWGDFVRGENFVLIPVILLLCSFFDIDACVKNRGFQNLHPLKPSHEVINSENGTNFWKDELFLQPVVLISILFSYR